MEDRHKKLMTIRAEHRPIDPEDIAEHELKYLEFKKDDTIRKRAELEMGQEEEQMRQQDMSDRYYKGKYRLMVLEQMLDQKYPLSAREVEHSKKERIKAYDHIIRQELRQNYDQKNASAETLQVLSALDQKFVRRVRNLNGSLTVSNRDSAESSKSSEKVEEKANRRSSEDLDAYKQGIRNLAFMKSLVRESIAKEERNPPLIRVVEEKEI